MVSRGTIRRNVRLPVGKYLSAHRASCRARWLSNRRTCWPGSPAERPRGSGSGSRSRSHQSCTRRCSTPPCGSLCGLASVGRGPPRIPGSSQRRGIVQRHVSDSELSSPSPGLRKRELRAIDDRVRPSRGGPAERQTRVEVDRPTAIRRCRTRPTRLRRRPEGQTRVGFERDDISVAPPLRAQMAHSGSAPSAKATKLSRARRSQSTPRAA